MPQPDTLWIKYIQPCWNASAGWKLGSFPIRVYHVDDEDRIGGRFPDILTSEMTSSESIMAGVKYFNDNM